MKSQLFWTEVQHHRTIPNRHSFSYKVFALSLHIEELARSLSVFPLLTRNFFGLCSIWDRDYLGDGPGTIKEKLASFLTQHGVIDQPSDCFLITMPRYFGYVFNPVNFYICFKEEALHYVIAEVNNTFGETHLYLMQPSPENPRGLPQQFSFPKEFFVSPFFEVRGEYKVVINRLDQVLSIQVSLYQDDVEVFSSHLTGNGMPITAFNLLLTIIKFPLSIILTMTRIHFQALLLYFKVKAAVFIKPQPTHPDTVRSEQSLIHRLRLAFLAKLRMMQLKN